MYCTCVQNYASLFQCISVPDSYRIVSVYILQIIGCTYILVPSACYASLFFPPMFLFTIFPSLCLAWGLNLPASTHSQRTHLGPAHLMLKAAQTKIGTSHPVGLSHPPPLLYPPNRRKPRRRLGRRPQRERPGVGRAPC